MQQKPIYFKTDFKVFVKTEAGFAVPFRFELYTNSPSRPFVARYDGKTYHNCQLLEDGRLLIAFDQHGMGLGKLMVKQFYYLNDKDYSDGVCDRVIDPRPVIDLSNKNNPCEIILSLQGDDQIEFTTELPPYYQQGLTPEEHEALINATVHAEEASNNANEQAGIATEAAQAADNARTALITAYNDKVAALDADYAAKKQTLDADYANTKQSLTSDYATVKAQLDADYAQKKAQLAQDYATAIAGINNRMTAIESLYTTDKAEWQRQVDAILAKCVSDFEAAEAQREARVNTAVQSATDATAQVNAAVQKASNVNAVLNGDNLTVTDQSGNSVTRNVRGPKGDSITMFPNVTIFGQPTIQESQISNFSADNYLQFPFVVDFAGRPWQIDCAITTGSNVSQQHNVLDSAFGLAFAFSGGKFVLALSSDGTSWNLGATSGTHTILANTTYYIRISWNGSVYKLAYSTDKETWVDDITVTSSASLASKQIIIGKSLDNRYIFNGSINMSEAHLTISGKIVWEGMDDAGLATRMAIDLSNIDEEGKQRVNQIVNDGVVGHKLSELDGETQLLTDVIKDDTKGNTDIVDGKGNVILRLNADGTNAKKYNVCDSHGNVVFSIDKIFLESIIKSSDVVDSLEDQSANKPLSAKQGSVLKEMAEKGVEVSQAFVIDDDGNLYFCDATGNYSVVIYKNGVFDSSVIGDKLKKIIKDLIDAYVPKPVSEKKKFVAIGDSITQGAGASNPNTGAWLSLLSNYLKSIGKIDESKNFGIGGNNSSGIASACGASKLYITNDVTIPRTIDPVEISLDSSMRLFDPAGNCHACSINESWEKEPCYLGNVAGFVTYNISTGKYYFTREEEGDAVDLKSYESIIPRSYHHCAEAEIMTIFVGTNNHVGSDPAKISALMDDLRKLAKLSKNGKYIVISPYANNNVAETQAMIQEFRKEYGSRHLDMLQYLSTRGVDDAVKLGLLPSGSVSSNWMALLLKDGTHPNDVGHRLIFEIVKQKFEHLKFI